MVFHDVLKSNNTDFNTACIEGENDYGQRYEADLEY